MLEKSVEKGHAGVAGGKLTFYEDLGRLLL